VCAAAANGGHQYEAFDAAQPVLASTIVALSLAASAVLAGLALADEPRGFLETVHKHLTLTTTVPDNGDQNPYAIVMAPVSAEKVQQDDVLIDNFNRAYFFPAQTPLFSSGRAVLITPGRP
jgi:hypothetical protein